MGNPYRGLPMASRSVVVKRVLVGLVLLLTCAFSYGQAKLPGSSAALLPMLNNEINTYWPQLQPRAFPAGVIDQESNWKPTARLKTARELGCGLGQFTIAYNSDGSTRFDALTETKALDKSLQGWDWRDCGEVKFQLRATLLKLKVNDRGCSALMDGNMNIKACGASRYNGGAGNTTGRIRLCRMDSTCNPREWFGNLEKQCTQSKTKVHGYGESFCEINSKYPRRVFTRMNKFTPYLPVSETHPLVRNLPPL
jgi:hypothetical protein